MRTTRILTSLLLCAATAACEGTFYTKTSSGLLPLRTTTITFGTALPDALEQVWSSCEDPLVLDPEATELDLGGSCTSTAQLPTGASQLLWAALASQPPVDVSGLFSDDLVRALTDVYHIQGFSWPMQNCDVYIDLGGMDIKGVSLTDLQSAWTSHDNLPSLWVDFDQTAGFDFASGSVEGDVACPNPLNEIFIKPSLPNGHYALSLDGLDIDIWLGFTYSGSDITASVEVNAELAGISISPALEVGDLEDILADAGYGIPFIERQVEHGLEDALAPVARQVADLLEDTIPSGQVVCSISVASGVLTMKTAAFCPVLIPKTI